MTSRWRGPEPFSLPRGPLGHLAGIVMALANAPVQRAVVEQLRLQGHEHALEIGFGPGVGAALLVRRLPQGHVCGVDPSEAILLQASQLNRRAIRQGRADLRLGTADDLPWENGAFDVVCSLNTVQLWDPLQASVGEVHRVLRNGGRLVIGVRDWWRKDPEGREEFTAEVEGALERAGFTDLRTRRKQAFYGPTLYFRARA